MNYRVPADTPWGTTSSKPFTFETRYLNPLTGTWSKWTASTHNRWTKSRWKGVSVLTHKRGGWRPPTPYRAYAAAGLSLNSFYYEYIDSAGRKAECRGQESYLPDSDLLFAAMTGSGHFPILQGARERAITEARNRLRDGDINLATSIAELGTTVEQLAELTIDLARLLSLMYNLWRSRSLGKGIMTASNLTVKELKTHRELNGHHKSISRRERSFLDRKYGEGFSSEWLGYQYGLLPLASDIYALAKRAQKQAADPLWITARRKIEYSLTLANPSPFRPGALMGVRHRSRTGAICRLDASVSNPLLAELDKLGLTNPLALGWELIPFSFVIDWLLPIGGMLTALTATMGLTFKGGSVTDYTIGDEEYYWTIHSKSTGGVPIHSRLMSITSSREKLSSFPLPRFYMKSPFSTTRSVTALALLSQLAK